MQVKTKEEFDKIVYPEIFALDTETTSLNPREAELEGFGWGDGKTQYYIDWGMCGFREDVIKKFAELFKTKEVIFHNAKFDMKILSHIWGIDYPVKIQDTMIMSWLLDENRGHGLKDLVKNVLKKEVVKYDDVPKEENLFFNREKLIEAMSDYCCADVRNTYDLYEKFRPKIEEEELWSCYEKIELPLIKILAKMESKGVRINIDSLKELSGKAESILLDKKSLIDQLVGVSNFNIRSSKQLREIIFDKLGVEPINKTPAGVPSTDRETLKELAKKHTEVEAILDFREFDKLNGTYLLGLQEKAENGIIYTDFLQHRTRSGRLASSNPNLQNIPARTDEFDVRKSFIPRKGYKFIVADYSQIELRVVAYFSQEPAMIKIFQDGGDIHQLTADMVGCSRKHAKAINFGLIYGLGYRSLAKDLEVSEYKAKEYMETFFQKYQKLNAYIAYVQTTGLYARKVTTLAKRKRRFIVTPKSSKGEIESVKRKLINTKIQGCLSGKTKILVKNKGYINIESIVNKKILVWDGENYVNAVCLPSGKKKKVEITFWGGRRIICSDTHKFLTLNTAGVIIWKTAKEFKKITYIKLTKEVENFQGQVKLEKQEKRTHNNKEVSFNSIKNQFDLGIVLGRLASDGTFNKNKNVGWLIAEHEYGIYQELENIISQLGKIRKYTHKRKKENKKDIKWLYIDSAFLAREVEEISIKNKIPNICWNNKEILAGFLKGMFDGDGGVSGHNIVLTFGKKVSNLKYAREIQKALDLLGIRSRVRYYKGDRSVVQIMKRDLKTFLDRIGFLNKNKQEKALKSLTTKGNVRGKEGKIYGNCERVKEIKFLEETEEMYDIVNSESGKFMADGLITHNSAADLMKIAMVKLERALKPLGAYMLLQIHDEVVVEAKEENVEEVMQIVKDTMESAIKLNIPIPVDAKIADCWVK